MSPEIGLWQPAANFPIFPLQINFAVTYIAYKGASNEAGSFGTFYYLPTREATEMGAHILPLAITIPVIRNHADDFRSHDVFSLR